MKRKVVHILILTLVIISASTAYAGNIKKGFVALQVHDYFKAKKAFEKGMKYNPEASAFGLAILYSRDNHVFYSKDSAYRYINMARTNLYDAKARKRKKWAKYGWSLAGIDSVEQIITDQFYAEAQQINTPASYDAFLKTHPNSAYAPRAMAIRDSIAFFSAVMENTSSSYQTFMESYPESEYFPLAEDNFYEVQFDELTGDGSLASYLEFIQLNANSPLRPAAEKKIFEIVTEANTAQSFEVFIRTYPDNSMVDSAWRQLYQTSSGYA
jgi:hypothetical protein